MAACSSPFRAIIHNAGINPKNLDTSGFDKPNYGYNVVSETFCDLMESGVIDPTKVTRTALEKAVSVASTLLTTECMIVNEVEESESKA